MRVRHTAPTPPVWQRPSRKSERSGRDRRALRAPTGWNLAPSCCNSRWVAVVLRDNAFTRAARPEGKGVDSQEGENRRCSPSCAQCGRAGRVPARDARAVPQRLLRRILMKWRAEVAKPEETARRVVAPYENSRSRKRGILRCAQDDKKRGGSPRLRERAPTAPCKNPRSGRSGGFLLPLTGWSA